MLLKLYQAGQPILRRSAQQLTLKQLQTRHVQDVIDFMIATLRDAPGVGLAAPQVGEPLQIFIIEDKATYLETVPAELLTEQGRKPTNLRIFVNPKLEVIDSSTALYFEGCLSVEGHVAAVARHKVVRISALDRHGKAVSYVARGWQARIVQHEYDHLQGELYIDKMHPKSFMSIKNFTMLWRKSLEASVRQHFDS